LFGRPAQNELTEFQEVVRECIGMPLDTHFFVCECELSGRRLP
jgi:hypothetical protein